ncbi:hypothetical protein E4665_17635 [Sporolactobacillus shoreae]|uniref:Phage tail assembly protein n=1 Tax=Sporolactobacillus shoreae TaxID=1465501 RepID=A0A4Z0GIS3_9BACL|nr:hypothetical protein [Sporolactobacillus shoreae]TGA95707.1 hypothetical protein E4665_17635 [Sporolactobacillus shoreae]
MSKIIKLELFNPQTQKKEVYEKNGANGKDTFEAFELLDKLEDVKKHTEAINALLDYVSGLFSGQCLTREAILKGVDSDQLLDTLNGVIGQVVGSEGQSGKK